MAKAFKVLVEVSDGTLLSCYAAFGCKLTYTPNQWTSPTLKGSKLFCFTKLDDAKAFASTIKAFATIAVWKAFATNIKPCHTVSGYAIPKDIVAFWDHNPAGYYKGTPPPGTHFADAIMITEEAWRIENV
jgi:hypothetical protein